MDIRIILYARNAKLNSYDTICHEHLEYYSLTVIKILSCNKMKVAK